MSGILCFAPLIRFVHPEDFSFQLSPVSVFCYICMQVRFTLSFISQTALLSSCSFRIRFLNAFVDLDHSLWARELCHSAWAVYQHGRFVR